MRPDEATPSLPELEEMLARRACPAPDADHRARVLSGMAEARQPQQANGWWWRIAAAIILALNITMTVSNAIRYQGLGTPPEARVSPTPETGDRFDRAAARALANVVPAPDAGALARRLFSTQEKDEWDMP